MNTCDLTEYYRTLFVLRDLKHSDIYQDSYAKTIKRRIDLILSDNFRNYDMLNRAVY